MYTTTYTEAALCAPRQRRQHPEAFRWAWHELRRRGAKPWDIAAYVAGRRDALALADTCKELRKILAAQTSTI